MKKQILVCLSALAFSSCDGAAFESSEEAEDKAAEPVTIAEILATGMQNPQLTQALNARLDAIEDPTVRNSELAEAGFEGVYAGRACTSQRYEGEERTRMGRDDTLRIQLTECRVREGMTKELIVNFGDAID